MNRTTVFTPGVGVGSSAQDRRAARSRPELRARRGKILVVAGWVVALAGIVVYCVATFASQSDADLAAILLHGAIPAARGGLGVIGLGTLMWLIGSVIHANAVLDRAGEPLRPRRDDEPDPGEHPEW